MTTNTEALRRAFEGYVNPDADIDLRWQAAGYYAGRNIQTSWLDFQAGHAAAKLGGAEVRSIRRLLSAGLTQREIAARFGVSQQTISGIKAGKRWGHVE